MRHLLNIACGWPRVATITPLPFSEMAGLVLAFRDSLQRAVFRQSQSTASLSKSPTFASTKRWELPRAFDSTVEGTIECLAGHAAALARENPAALAQLTAYLHVVETVDSLYRKYGVGEQRDGEESIQRAAKLVGLRLPKVSTSRPDAASGKRECRPSTYVCTMK